MSCNLQHTVEQLQQFIKKETEKGDAERQNAIVEVINMFEVEKQAKLRLREHYAACKHISDGRKYVIDMFLYEKYCKDTALVDSLWVCVNQIQSQVSN